MELEKEFKNKKDENNIQFVGFCRENCKNGVDEKHLQIYDGTFEKGKNCFFVH